MAKGVTRLDALVPCTKEEILLVLKDHEAYLRAFARRRENIYTAALSMDEAIREAAYRRNHSIGEVPGRGHTGDPVYAAFVYAEDMTRKQRSYLIRRLKMLALEERKFGCIMEAFGSLPPSSQEFLLDKFKNRMTNEELYARYIGEILPEDTATKIRRKIENRYERLLGLVLERCTYEPPAGRREAKVRPLAGADTGFILKD